MGAGKTVVGRLLAKAWQLEFQDSDTLVERLTGQSVAQLFNTGGEAAFRLAEQRVIRQALISHGGVLSLGGGALTNPDTLALIQSYRAAGGAVVFLDVSADQGLGRIDNTASRPMLAGPEPKTQWATLAAARRPAWQANATLTIQTDRLTPTAVAQLIATQLA